MSETVGVTVLAESYDYQTLVFAEDSLVDVPGCAEMGEDDRTHGGTVVRRTGARRLAGVVAVVLDE